jgi:VanZ family protein
VAPSQQWNADGLVQRGTIPRMRPLIAHFLYDPKFYTHWRALLALLLGVTCWFAFSPHPPGLVFKDADKVQHFLAFSSLTLVTCLSMAAGTRQTLGAALGMLMFGIFIELVQSQLPTRTAEFADVVADSVGIAGGLIFLWLLRRFIPKKSR